MRSGWQWEWKWKRWLVTAIFSAVASLAWSSSGSQVRDALADGLTPSQVIMRSGSEYLLRGDLHKAKSVFNTGLKFDFYNANLHVLNALAYHQSFLNGNPDDFSLALAGYRIALMLDPELSGLANLQLARLQFDARDYDAAKAFAGNAVAADRRSSEALSLLAQTAMLGGDKETARWALAELERVAGSSSALIRMNALLAALEGDSDRAQRLAGQYAESSRDPAEASHLKARVAEVLASPPSPQEQSGSVGEQSVSAPDAAAEKKSGDVPAQPATSAEPSGTQWFRCDTTPALPSYQQIRVGDAETDESIMAEVLPAPCPGERPEQALFAVTVVATTEAKSENVGINLLDGLSGIWTLSSDYFYTKDSGEPSTSSLQRTNNLVLSNAIGSSGDDVLRYALNIASSAYSRSEVLLRPTLSAIDRVPAVLFVGSTYTLGIGGNDGSSAEIEDHSTGLSLSITPTFMPGDDVLVSLRVTRGAIVPTESDTILLQANRSVLTGSAMLQTGDTFVLSGLSQDEVDRSRNGVPGLQDIPVLRHLFRTSVVEKISVSLLALVTYYKGPAARREFIEREYAKRFKDAGVEENSRPYFVEGVGPEAKFDLERLKNSRSGSARKLRRRDVVEPPSPAASNLENTVHELLRYANDL